MKNAFKKFKEFEIANSKEVQGGGCATPCFNGCGNVSDVWEHASCMNDCLDAACPAMQ